MLKLKLQYFGYLMRRVDSLEKDSDAGRDWGQEDKGTTEDEMAGCHHQLDGPEFFVFFFFTVFTNILFILMKLVQTLSI